MNSDELKYAAYQAESEAPQTFAALDRIQSAALDQLSSSAFTATAFREQMYHLVQACKALRQELLGLKGHAEMIRHQEQEQNHGG